MHDACIDKICNFAATSRNVAFVRQISQFRFLQLILFTLLFEVFLNLHRGQGPDITERYMSILMVYMIMSNSTPVDTGHNRDRAPRWLVLYTTPFYSIFAACII